MFDPDLDSMHGSGDPDSRRPIWHTKRKKTKSFHVLIFSLKSWRLDENMKILYKAYNKI
jgi:hypothetical protein